VRTKISQKTFKKQSHKVFENEKKTFAHNQNKNLKQKSRKIGNNFLKNFFFREKVFKKIFKQTREKVIYTKI
jgi:hypothetical protein